MAINPSPHLASLRLLVNDFKTLLSYVEPVDDNLKVYSHRLYELLLRSCTEFESICKSALQDKGRPVSSKANILEYRSLEADLHLEAVEVGIHLWQPNSVYLRPFHSWSTAEPPLSWYSSYNQVKHDRDTKFSHANLENVRLAIAGLFALLSALDLLQTNVPGHTVRDIGSHLDTLYVAFPEFSVRRPK